MNGNNNDNKTIQNGENILAPLCDFYTKAFKFFNTTVFENILPDVGLLVQRQRPRSRNLGYFMHRFFVINNKEIPLLTIVVDEIIDIDIKRCLGTLIHEMVHFEAKTKSIKDCSKSNFHNLNFKALAANRGYIIETKDKRIGWSSGKANDELNKVFDKFLLETPFPYNQFEVIKFEKSTPTKTLFNYFCPQCGVIVKGKKDTDIICGVCDVSFEMQDDSTLDKIKNILNIL